jgi:flavin-dependent dehydrogenase
MECIVVGAGTSGLMLARELARDGIYPTVYERKAKGAPIKQSSGILSVSGLRSLGISPRGIELNKLYAANIYFGSIGLKVRSEKLQAYTIDRTLLSKRLAEEAASNGARLEYNKTLTKSELTTTKGIIVGADGAASLVASHFGFPSIERIILTYRAEYKTRKEDMESVDIFFDNEITKGFFGWVAPHGDDIEVGVGIDEKFGRSIDAFRRFTMKKSVKELIKNARLIGGWASIIPLSLRRYFVDEKKKVLLVGDAAGQVKSTTGGGIIFGGNGAIIAAKAISNHIQFGDRLVEYQRAWLKEFGKDVRLHNLIHSIYSSLSNRQLELFARALKAIGIEGILSKYGDMDRPSLIIKRLLRLD